MLTKTGISQPFDKKAKGYVRAEACGVVFLQKSENAKRIYATVVNVKVNNDGFKTEGMILGVFMFSYNFQLIKIPKIISHARSNGAVFCSATAALSVCL